jgi:ParB family chromosome partitioning protein
VPVIALVCAGYEKTIAKDSWRSPARSHLAYLNQLVSWGYTASEVEQIILDSIKPAAEPEEADEDTEDTEETETFEEVHADEEDMIAEEIIAE